MADEGTISIEALKKYAELLEGELKSNAESFVAMLERSNMTMASSTEVTNALGVSIDDVSKAVEKATDVIGGMLVDLRSNFALLDQMISGAADNLVEVGTTAGFALAPVLEILPRTTEAFSNLGKAGNVSGSQIAAGYSDVAPMFEKMIGVITRADKDVVQSLSRGLNRLAQSMDIGTNLERNLVRLAARAGDLNKLLNEQGVAYRDLQTESSSFATLTYEVAQATGTSVDEVQKYAESLSPIPGSLRRTSLGIDGLRNTMSELEAVMKVATAFGMSTAESTDVMNFAYSALNQTGTDAVSMLANIAQTSQDTVLPLQLVSDFVKRTSDSFKLLGDNSQGAMTILKAFSPILKESGLGPAGIQEIVQSMTSGIERMNIAHKAFISGATGGPGGLAGGFEIDLLLKEGRLDEVLGRTMEAMQRQFGTSPVTLEDVNRTPALAGELLKQVSFLRDVAGIAQNDQQAFRILEAMKKGAPEELANLRDTTDPNAVLDRTLTLGNELQQRGNTELTRIFNRLGHLSDLSAIANAHLARATIGIEGRPSLAEDMRDDSVRVTERGGVFGADKPVTFERAVEEQLNVAKELKESFKDISSPILESVGIKRGAQEQTMEPGIGSALLEAAGEGEQQEVPIFNKVLRMLGIQGPTSSITPAPETRSVIKEPGNAFQNTFSTLPALSRESQPGILASAISDAARIDRDPQETAEVVGRGAPLDGTLDVNIKLTGIDEINKVIEKKFSVQRSQLVQGALIGNEG